MENKEKMNNQELELKDSGIFYLDIDLNREERNSIEKLEISRVLPQFNYYGSSGEELVKSFEVHLEKLGNNSPEIVENIVELVARVSDTVTKKLNKQSNWVMVRTFLPNKEFEIPRWHQDGKYFISKDKVYKMAMTIKGAQTRFGKTDDMEKFQELLKKGSENITTNLIEKNDSEKFKEEDIQIRKELNSIVHEMESPKEGEAVIYLVGDENAAIHSEPLIDNPRLFVSVLPGSKEEINEWRERNEKKNK